MTDPDIESDGEAGAAPDNPVLLRRLRVLADRRDWAAICALLHPDPPGRVALRVIPIAIDAALATGHEAVLDWAACAAITRDLPHRMRAQAAYRLARAGRPALAWSVLAADPATPFAADARGLVSAALAMIHENGSAAPAERAAARALARRLAGIPEDAPPAAPFRIPDAGPCAPPAFPVALRLAPGVDPGFGAEVARMIADGEAAFARTEAPPIDVFEDVFTNRHGHVWRSDGRLVGRQAGVLPPGTAAAMAMAPRIAAGVHATGLSNNFYHWFGAWLPSLCWRLAPGVPRGLPILLRSDAASYQTESLDLVFGTEVPILPVAEATHLRTLYRVRENGVRMDPAGPYEPMIARMIAAVEARTARPAVAGERLYISRRDSPQRPLGNEAELEAVLAALGFTAVTMTEWPLAEKIAIVRAASVIVAPHGAGLSLLLFARPGTSVFELLPAMPRTMSVRLCMTRLSRARGHRHLAWVEPCDEATGRWSCAIAPLVAALEEFIAGA
ncbi:DUF563 domain-containing protein [Roseomonas sp. CECT 9278]|uniref:glycosyltransferase family 61 protein n=1 Tax=Roseomonas sp. CECT 9278 TaxID=2845823 RepID=UPI001E42EE03|nr:glycosyltransferase family 61 protein [Roseomonas sp. CECT 9278]CAH0204096.1 hypothetical protein ROS9278_01999 [Roseomonas sp. CECT 9278]